MKFAKWFDMSVVVISRLVQALVALGSLRVMTTLLSVEEVGRWSLVMATISFFSLGCINPCGMFINRRLHSWVKTGIARHYMVLYLIYLFIVAVFSAGLLGLINLFYDSVPGMPLSWTIVLVSLSLILGTLNQTIIPSLNLLGHRIWFSVFTLLTVVFGLILSVVLVYWGNSTAALWQMGQILAQGLLAIVAGKLFFQVIHLENNKSRPALKVLLTPSKIKSLFFFSWPLIIAVLCTWVQNQSYRFIAQEMIGLKALGLFTVGYGISASLMSVYESIFSTYFQPRFYKKISSDQPDAQVKAWFDYASVMLSGVILATAVVISVASELTRVLLNIKFSAAAPFVALGIVAEAARVVVATYALIAHAKMKTKFLIWPNFISAIAAPILVYLLCAKWGAMGVGIGLVLAGLLAIISTHVVLSRAFCFKTPWQYLARNALIACFMVGLSWLAHFVIEPGGMVCSMLWLLVYGSFFLISLYFVISPSLEKG